MEPSDEDKIFWFDRQYQYVKRILDCLQNTSRHIPAGTNLLEWLAEYLEANFE